MISATVRIMVKYLLYILCLTAVFGCDSYINSTPDEIAEHEAQFYTDDFLEHKLKKDFELVDIDSFDSFGELLESMEALSCEDKSIGVEFKYKNVSYHIMGYAECPTSGIISCHFNQNIIFVKNDSLRLSEFESDKHDISELKNEIIKFNDYSEYHAVFGKRKLKPVLIFLYVEDKLPIAKTKEIIKEIVQQFKDVNEELGTERYTYYLKFERYSYLDIPPPPPPPPILED